MPDLFDHGRRGIESPDMPRVALATIAVIISVASANFAGPPQQAGPGSLIVNGSFEDGPPVRTFFNIVAGASSLKGWRITGEGVDIVHDVYW